MKTKAITFITCLALTATMLIPGTVQARSHHGNGGDVISALAVGLGVGLLAAAIAEPETKVVYQTQSIVTQPAVVYQTPIQTVTYQTAPQVVYQTVPQVVYSQERTVYYPTVPRFAPPPLPRAPRFNPPPRSPQPERFPHNQGKRDHNARNHRGR